MMLARPRARAAGIALALLPLAAPARAQSPLDAALHGEARALCARIDAAATAIEVDAVLRDASDASRASVTALEQARRDQQAAARELEAVDAELLALAESAAVRELERTGGAGGAGGGAAAGAPVTPEEQALRVQALERERFDLQQKIEELEDAATPGAAAKERLRTSRARVAAIEAELLTLPTLAELNLKRVAAQGSVVGGTGGDTVEVARLKRQRADRVAAAEEAARRARTAGVSVQALDLVAATARACAARRARELNPGAAAMGSAAPVAAVTPAVRPSAPSGRLAGTWRGSCSTAGAASGSERPVSGTWEFAAAPDGTLEGRFVSETSTFAARGRRDASGAVAGSGVNARGEALSWLGTVLAAPDGSLTGAGSLQMALDGGATCSGTWGR